MGAKPRDPESGHLPESALPVQKMIRKKKKVK